ncbi:MAG: HPr family phosphocarrier protein [Zetaproteobacteria bacterium]|nr:MAG: HPr family phosphocarrier protein [Zetaproteobacteria bacterium]
MAECCVRIVNKLGLHARASAKLATLANRFQSEIALCKDGVEVNAKSIMGIMMLAAPKGSELRIRAEGEDAEQAIKALTELIQARFGEAE